MSARASSWLLVTALALPLGAQDNANGDVEPPFAAVGIAHVARPFAAIDDTVIGRRLAERFGASLAGILEANGVQLDAEARVRPDAEAPADLVDQLRDAAAEAGQGGMIEGADGRQVLRMLW